MNIFTTKQKLLILLVLVVILAVVSQFIGFLTHTTTHSPTAPSNTSIPTPTVVFAPLPKDFSSNTTITTVPSQTDNVPISTHISASFPRAISNSEKQSIQLQISPSISGNTSWSDDNKTISFVPSQLLQTSQQYTVTLLYFTKKLTWEFTTVSSDNLSQQDVNQMQLQSDNNFANWQKSLYQSYPWYNALPIQSNSYFVYFDINTKKFIATLYVTSSDPIVDALKKDVLSEFQQKNIPTTKYPIVWEYNSTPGSE